MRPLSTERVLGRMIFARFFESDMLPAGVPQVQLLIWGTASLTAPGYLLAFAFAFDYGRVLRPRLNEAALADELLFVLFGMVALGAVALTIWEGVFPDRRDVRILAVLPLSSRTHVLARLGALGAVAMLFCIGINLPAAVVYGMTLWGNAVTGSVPRSVLAHLIATSLAGVFVFFILIAAQGALLTLFGRRSARRLALVMQVGFVMVLLQSAVLVPALGARLRAAFLGQPDSLIALLPPAWFLGLYNRLAGTGVPVPIGYAIAAAAAALASILIATTLIATSYKRLVKMALEASDGAPRPRPRLLWRLCSGIVGVIAPSPVGRAAAEFTLVTFVRSRTHLTLLATYAGVAAAVVLFSLVPVLARRGMAALSTPSPAMLSVPLVATFILLCGMRTLAALPIEARANWAFRLYAPDDRQAAAIDGVRVAFLVSAVGPIAIAAAMMGVLLWGARAGLLHGLFTACAGMLLLDLLLVGLRKIPFTCTYYPGRARARTMWPFYLIAFGVYAYGLAAVEAQILAGPATVGIVATGLLTSALAMGFARLRRLHLEFPPGLVYAEPDPDALFSGFRLSEGMAAERTPSQAPR